MVFVVQLVMGAGTESRRHQPMTLRPLFPYQLQTVQRLVAREQNAAVALPRLEPDMASRVLHLTLSILGGRPGIGKSAMMLSLIATYQCPVAQRNLSTTYVVTDTVGYNNVLTTTRRLTRCAATLVLCTGSVRHAWKREQELVCPGLRCKVLDSCRALSTLDPHDWDILIVNGTVFDGLMTAFPTIEWWRFVYDEVDSFLRAKMAVFPVRFTWFVSATWMVLRDFVGSVHCRRTRKNQYHRQMCAQLSLPDIAIVPAAPRDLLPPTIAHIHRFSDRTNAVGRVLGSLVSEGILRQLRAEDPRGAMQAMGITAESGRSIVTVVRMRVEERERDLRALLAATSGNNPRRRATLQEDLHAMCRRRTDLELRIAAEASQPCLICTEPMQRPALLPCQHLMCTACIVQWSNTAATCPVCRAPFRRDQLLSFVDGQPLETLPLSTSNPPSASVGASASLERTPDPQSRAEALLQVLATCPPESTVVVFAMFTGSLDTIERICRHTQQYTIVRLRGNATSRDRTIQDFRRGARNTTILLLDSREACAGIHLPEMTDAILFHEMPPDIETQAIGRGCRLGATHSLRVHRFQSS